MYLESHDEERFVCARHDLPLYQNALAFLFFTEGIPIVMYGAEQSIAGTRDPMWNAGYHTNTELYVFIKMLNWWVA
jgi:alpha-amylase